MIHFVLIRHGETPWTREKRYQGSSNTRLTPLGKEQIRRFNNVITHYKPDVIFSSALDRCIESARILCKPLKKKPNIDPRLNELRFGHWEGKTAEELVKERDLTYAKWAHGHIVKPKGGESLTSLRRRIKSFIKDIRKEYDDKKIIIVTHGGVIRMFLMELFEISQNHMFQFRIDPGTMTILGYYQYSRQLILLNSTNPPKKLVPRTCA